MNWNPFGFYRPQSRKRAEYERQQGVLQVLGPSRRRINPARLDPKQNMITFPPDSRLDKPAVRNRLPASPRDQRMQKVVNGIE